MSKIQFLWPAWVKDAACAGIPTDAFMAYRTVDETVEEYDIRLDVAANSCASCPVALDCLLYGLDIRDFQAIMGNTTPEDRWLLLEVILPDEFEQQFRLRSFEMSQLAANTTPTELEQYRALYSAEAKRRLRKSA